MLDARSTELLRKPSCSVPQFAEMFGLSLNAAYKAVDRGEIEAVRIGKRIVVPTAPLRRMLHVDEVAPAPPSSAAA